MRASLSEARNATAAALLVATLAVALAAIDPSFFVKDDFQLEFLPASKEIARAWSSGEVPLLTRTSWVCAALAAEYQFGVFSIFRMLLEGLAWLLPLSLVARGTMLFVVHAAVAAAGGFLLARDHGVRSANAVMVAVVAGLNGWILFWGTTWYAIAASYAWLPWYWLGLRGIAAGRRWSWVGAAIALHLLVTGGAPYVVAMAALVAATCILGLRRNVLAIIGASALGLALSAPAVLMLLEYFPVTARSGAATTFEDLWVVPIRALLGLVIPAVTTTWTVFTGPQLRAAVELLGAFVPLAAIAALAAERRRPGGWPPGTRAHVLLVLLLLVLMLLPSAGPFRWSFRWLPLFHLALAILGAIALEHTRRAWIAGLALLAVTLVVAHDATTLTHAAMIAVLCLAWPRFENAMPALVSGAMVVMTFLSFAHRSEVPRWDMDAGLLQPAPFDPSRRYLAMYGLDAILAPDEHGRFSHGIGAELRPANVPMLAGLRFVNGYSPMGLDAMLGVFRFSVNGPMPLAHAQHLLVRESGPQQLLHHAGVDGLIVPAALANRHAALLSRNGWTAAGEVAGCVILHRDRLSDPLFAAAIALKTEDHGEAWAAIFARRSERLPVVLLAPGGPERYGRRGITDVVDARNHVSFVVRGKGPKALVVFRRPWLPGWRATIDGRPLPVLRANMIMPAIEIPGGAEGEVRLAYRPRGLVVGTAIAGLALLAMSVVAVRIRRGR